MKARTLISVIVVILAMGIFNNTVNAQKKSLVHTNIVETETGVIKTYLFLDNVTKKPISKKVYKRDNAGYISEIVNYVWNSKTGWQYKNKLAYVYSESNKLLSVTSTDWDIRDKEWSNTSKCMVYTYKGQGNLVEIKSYKIDKTKDILLTELVK